ncbi:MAG: hypothetical protein AB7T10_02500 [bacterium]
MGKKIVFIMAISTFICNTLMPYEIIGIVEDAYKTEILLKKSAYNEKVVFSSFGSDSVKIDGKLSENADSICLDSLYLLRKVTFYSPLAMMKNIVDSLEFQNREILMYGEGYKGRYKLDKGILKKTQSLFNYPSLTLPCLSLLLITCLYAYGEATENDDIKDDFHEQIPASYEFFKYSLIYSLAEMAAIKLVSLPFQDRTDGNDPLESYQKGFRMAGSQNQELEAARVLSTAAHSAALFIPTLIVVASINKNAERVNIEGATESWILFTLIHFITNQTYWGKNSEQLFMMTSFITGSRDMFFLRGYIDGCYEK